MLIEEMDEELLSEEWWKADEVEAWETLMSELDDVLESARMKRNRYRKLTHEVNTPEYDEFEHRLYGLQEYVAGRLQEVNPEYVKHQYDYEDGTERERDLIRYATQEGINWYGLKHWYWKDDDRQRIIEYLSSNGLASMKYQATLDTVGRIWRKEMKII